MTGLALGPGSLRERDAFVAKNVHPAASFIEQCDIQKQGWSASATSPFLYQIAFRFMKLATLTAGAVALMAFGLGAQAPAKPKQEVTAKTETVYTFDIRGISG